ncbi:VWA domain-containing protein [Natronospirillum operosum]|uniref:VWA domain-containing protein n=1 Tax=Natronospirillum operosum TaxID=2759953 RepID=A0A4Z0WJ41_9GAMM|nr:VWA domain-containing protein [Natronospirillum operosum]TGG95551.1 VWA domain-containing protein [Natronospirillum operosum]
MTAAWKYRIGCIVLALVLALPAWGQQQPPFDLRILVDVSSDMAENDPDNLRLPAAHLLFELMPEGSRSGLWTFGRYVNMLVPYGTVNADWRQRARARAQEIGSPGFNSNIGGAFETASFDLDWSTGHNPKTYILLSDGLVNIEPDAAASRAERTRILEEIVPRLREHNSVIHTIALSEYKDRTFMEQVASQTGGLSAVAEHPEDMLALLMQILNISLGTQEEVGIDEDQRFLIDSTISEMTAAVFHEGDQNIVLISPSGERFEADNPPPHTQWVSTDNYDVITIRTPAAGEWQVEGTLGPQSRVTVVSELSLQLDAIPLNVGPGETIPLRAVMNDAEGQVTDSDFLDLMTVEASLLQEGEVRRTVSLQRGSPEFVGQLTMPSDAGSYQLRVEVDGQSFQRRRVFTLNVRQPLSAEVSAGEAAYEIRLYPNLPDIPAEVGRIVAQVTGPDGSTRLQAFERREAGHWSVEIEPFAGEGQYSAEVDVQFTGASRWTGGIQVAPVDLSFPGQAGMPVEVSTVAPVPVPEPEPESVPPVALEPVPSLDDLMAPQEPARPEPEPQPETVPAPETDADPVPAPEPEPEESAVPDLDTEPPPAEAVDWMPYLIAAGSGLAFVLVFYAIYRKFGGGRDDDDPRLHDELSRSQRAVLSEVEGKGAADDELDRELRAMAAGAPAASDIPTVSDVESEDELSVLDDDFDLESLGIGDDNEGEDGGAKQTAQDAPERQGGVDPLEQDDPFADDEFDISDDDIDDMLDDTLADDNRKDEEDKP